MNVTQLESGRIFRSLGALLHAGIAPAEGLLLLAQEERSLAPLLTALSAQLDQGQTLSDAMTAGGAFPLWVTAMIRVGEETGRLEESLTFLADYCDEGCRTARLLRRSLAYPLALLVLMLLVIGLLLTKVLPVFDQVYASLGTELTGLAGWLLALGQGLDRGLPVLGIVLAAVLGAWGVYSLCRPVKNYVNQEFRRRFSDTGILQKFNNARFARALAMGIGSGLTEPEAVRLSGRLMEASPGAAARCARAAAMLEQGTDLAQALEETGLLSAPRCRMLAVGLRSGSVDALLTQVADRTEEDARDALTGLIGAVEPGIVLLSAGLVGLILLSVMVPLLEILSALG